MNRVRIGTRVETEILRWHENLEAAPIGEWLNIVAEEERGQYCSLGMLTANGWVLATKERIGTAPAKDVGVDVVAWALALVGPKSFGSNRKRFRKRAAIQARHSEALRLRRAGLSYREIGLSETIALTGPIGAEYAKRLVYCGLRNELRRPDGSWDDSEIDAAMRELTASKRPAPQTTCPL